MATRSGTLNKSKQTRERILDAAARIFRRRGYAATTLDDIARIAKLRAASIYYYFNSKDHLFEEVLDIGIDRIHREVRRRLDAAPAGASFRDRIRIAIEVHLATLLRHSDYTAANVINYGLAPEIIRRRHRERREAYGDLWRDLLGKAKVAGEIAADADLSLMRLFMIGALNWSQEWYHPKGKTIAQLADEICRMIFDGVGPAPTRKKSGRAQPQRRT